MRKIHKSTSTQNQEQPKGPDGQVVYLPKMVITPLDEPTAVDKKVDHKPKSRLELFEKLKGRALLSEEELAEKQKLLSHPETLNWLETELSKKLESARDQLEERLALIDILEVCVTWKENPLRSDFLDAVERIIQVNNFGSIYEESSRQAIGDKIELYALLIDEAPDRAKALVENVKDRHVQRILRYALKRLGLDRKETQ